MTELFKIETDDVELVWRAPLREGRKLAPGLGEQMGHLRLNLRSAKNFLQVWRKDVPDTIATEVSATNGPQLYEQVNYKLFVRSKTGKRIGVIHEDPNIQNCLDPEDNGKVIHGSINFGSEVGFSKFTVTIDRKPEFDFTVEVFPSKLDYKSDYEQLVAEVQDYIAGVALEFVRSTFRLSLPTLDRRSSTLEWLLLLQMIIKDLEKACAFVSHTPIRNLVRQAETIKAERIKRLDSFVRRAVQKGAGSGEYLRLDEIQLREVIPSKKTTFTLDTPEHRWIATQLKRIHEKLIALRIKETTRADSNRPRKVGDRQQKLIDSLTSLERRILTLQQLEPFRKCAELPPSGFASLQLISAPGYRECYRACNMLTLGLRIEGGPVDLSLKEISTLYEYWCFLTVVYLISEHVKQPVPFNELIKVNSTGLEIILKAGKKSKVTFEQENGRR